MNILVLNGSPKGENSITLQTVRFLEALHPEHSFRVLHVGQRIKALEKDFSPAAEALADAELLLFSYPVYTFLAPSQLHRFFELLKASGVSVHGKYMTQITTSKHFYDITAHRYIEDNCHDLGMNVLHGLSADMDDLLHEQGRRDAASFFSYVLFCITNGIREPEPLSCPVFVPVPVTVPGRASEKRSGDIVIVTDTSEKNSALSAMIARFRAVMPMPTRVVNLREYPFSGGCLGCFHCAVTGECVYRDGFDEFLRNTIQSSDAIVYAFSVRDHSMGALFKCYDDRQFCNGHRTVTMGMPMAYLIDGPYRQEENLQNVVEARCQVGGNYLCGTATNECDPNGEIDALAKKLSYALVKHYTQPKNFWGVGGMKIFRDLIYTMRGMMKADHAFYRDHGQYDFPQKQVGTIAKMYLVGALLSSPKLQKAAGSKMTEGMLAPYKKALEKAKTEKYSR